MYHVDSQLSDGVVKHLDERDASQYSADLSKRLRERAKARAAAADGSVDDALDVALRAKVTVTSVARSLDDDNEEANRLLADSEKVTPIEDKAAEEKAYDDAEVFAGDSNEAVEAASSAGAESLMRHEGGKDSGKEEEGGGEAAGFCQPMTLCFRLSNVDVDLAFRNSEKINALYKQFRAAGKIKNPREDVLKFKYVADGVLHLNSTRIVKRSPFDLYDLSFAEREARRQMFELYTFLKENCAGFENCTLLSSAPEIGVRESRMIDGLYTLTVSDLKDCVHFEDSVAACNYDIDIHNPEGTGTSHYYFKEGTYYTIPYRSLIPKNIRNLLAAGRCISGCHEAQASFRIMPTCCSTGQAAGLAAAAAVQDRTALPETDVSKIQALLRRHHAFF